MLWAAWYPYVQPEVPGAPQPLIDHYVRQAAIYFLKESQVWTQTLDAIDIVDGTASYTLTVPASITTGAEVSMVKWAWADGNQIFPASQEELSMLNSNWETMTGSALTHYTQLVDTEIRVFPEPDFSLTGGLVIKAVLRPTLTSTGVPDWIGTKYVNEIAAKAKADMMGMVSQPWTNPDGETKYSTLFASTLAKATVEANKSFTRTSPAVRFRNYESKR